MMRRSVDSPDGILPMMNVSFQFVIEVSVRARQLVTPLASHRACVRGVAHGGLVTTETYCLELRSKSERQCVSE